MNRIVSITGALTRGLFGGIHLLWKWAVYTTLVTVIASFAMFLATKDIGQFDLVFFQELFRGYAMLAAIAVPIYFLLSTAVWYFFGNRAMSSESGNSISSKQQYES